MKIGIYGGTFDPPHIGHERALQAFLEQFDFDAVYVIPVFVPPHKSLKSDVSTDDRLNMSKIAFEGMSDKVVVSDLEIKRRGKSYTADTIKHFKDEGCDEIFFLCGTDMLLTLDMWYKPEYILSNAKIVFARRESDEENTVKIAEKINKYKELYSAVVFELSIKVLEISSTQIRDSLSAGKCEFLSPSVYAYIQENGLYKDR